MKKKFGITAAVIAAIAAVFVVTKKVADETDIDEQIVEKAKKVKDAVDG